MMICLRCRNFFKVWASQLDERIGLINKDPQQNPNWQRGGDRRSRNAKPLALNTKKQAERLSEAANSEHSFEVGERIDNDEFIQINRTRENSPMEAPEDDVQGLEDPLNEQLSYDTDDDDEEVQNPTEEPSTEVESIIINNIDSSFMRGKILLLPVSDGATEVPLCALCHQVAIDGEIVTNLLENRLRKNLRQNNI